jgi:hypothetical protein
MMVILFFLFDQNKTTCIVYKNLVLHRPNIMRSVMIYLIQWGNSGGAVFYSVRKVVVGSSYNIVI